VAAAEYGPESLPEDFFDAEMVLFGATALVPPLHDTLDELCRKAKKSNAFVVVTTVFDFRNEGR
jgi:sugar/nucleoside kinase (ribokinase family)